MKAVIPAAGRGTRLYPHTHTKPKPMVRVAGKPIIGHILHSLAETAIADVILIVGGPMQEQITSYARSQFGDRFDITVCEQEHPEGLGHSIYQADMAVGDQPALITLGDMLFHAGYTEFIRKHESFRDVDASIGVKQVDDPERYGVVDLDSDRRIQELVEKPDNPSSNWAISGVYIVENSSLLFDALSYLLMNQIRGPGDEYQLTDAFQVMCDRGATLGAFEVEDWYDCGRPETLLDANRVLLSRRSNGSPCTHRNAVLIPPVDFGEDVTVESSVVGPNVSIDDATVVRNSLIEESIIGQDATVNDSNLCRSIIGNHAVIDGEPNQINLGDNSSIEL